MKNKLICPNCQTPMKKLKHSTLCGCGNKLTTINRSKR